MSKADDNRDLYYQLLKKKMEHTNMNNPREVREYNEYVRNLRHMLLDES